MFDLCYILSEISKETWHRIGFIRSLVRARIFETTITQNIVYTFFRFSKLLDLPILIFESQDENANGADLEIFIEGASGFVGFECQAKLISKNQRYPSLRHESSGHPQIDLLIAYANRRGTIPLYLLYNHCNGFSSNPQFEESHLVSMEQFGCSIIDARLVKSNFTTTSPIDGTLHWRIPTFIKIHSLKAFPISVLACDLIKLPVDELSHYFGVEQELRVYPKDELLNEIGWLDLLQEKGISGIDVTEEAIDIPNLIEENSKVRSQDVFNPKFRLVFSNEPLKGQMRITTFS